MTGSFEQVSRWRGFTSTYTALPARSRLRIEILILVTSLPLWLLSTVTWTLGPLDLRYTPFMLAPWTFWLAFLLTIFVNLTSRTHQVRWLSIGLIFTFSTISLALIEPFGRMHDSAVILRDSLAAVGGNLGVAYGGDFPLAYVFLGILQTVAPLGPWAWSRLFVAVSVGIYLILAIALAKSVFVRNTGERSSRRSDYQALGFVLFFAAFSWFLQLRINPAPQTIGFLLFLVLLLAVVRTPASRRFFVFFTLLYFAVLLSHPLSAILAFPGIFAMLYLRISRTHTAYRRPRVLLASLTSTEIVLAAVIFWAWIVYRAGGLITYASDLFQRILAAERVVPTITTNTPAAAVFAQLNLLFLVLLGAALLVSVYVGRKSRSVGIALIWGAFLLPVGFLLFGAPFFPRIFLFMAVPTALVFAAGFGKMAGLHRKLRWIPTTLLASLLILGVLVSYYHDSALDRSTLGELRAYEFAFEKGIGTIWVDGLQVPFNEQGLPFSPHPIVGSTRGTMDMQDLGDSEIVPITQQMENYAAVIEGKVVEETSVAQTRAQLQEWNMIYDNGFSTVFGLRT